MAQRTRSSKPNTPAPSANRANGGENRPSPEEELLKKAERMLQDGEVEKALELVSRSKLKSPWVVNIMGVCLLRLGRAKAAADLLRGIVLAAGGVTLRLDVPTAMKVNFATALLMSNNVDVCESVLNEINDAQHPMVKQIREAIRRWRKSLSLWQKVRMLSGQQPDRPVELDFAPGCLQ
jgi:hypothetical protein